MFSRLGGLAPPEWFSLSLSLCLFSRACIRIPPLSLYPLLFLLFAWATFPRYDNFYFTLSVTCWPYLWNVGNVYFTFLLCVIALCMMCVYIYIYIYIYIFLRMCGWSCTLYDELSWLHEWPSLAMCTLDLVTWVYAQGDYCKCIFMSYYVHSCRGVTVLIHVTKWHRFPHVCDMY